MARAPVHDIIILVLSAHDTLGSDAQRDKRCIRFEILFEKSLFSLASFHCAKIS